MRGLRKRTALSEPRLGPCVTHEVSRPIILAPLVRAVCAKDVVKVASLSARNTTKLPAGNTRPSSVKASSIARTTIPACKAVAIKRVVATLPEGTTNATVASGRVIPVGRISSGPTRSPATLGSVAQVSMRTLYSKGRDQAVTS